jgi:hypothetical protein
MADDEGRARPEAAAGPLAVSVTNPRYFTVASGEAADRRAVYLTGSHIWNNFHDDGPPRQQPWASLEAVARDPDGNGLVLQQA